MLRLTRAYRSGRASIFATPLRRAARRGRTGSISFVSNHQSKRLPRPLSGSSGLNCADAAAGLRGEPYGQTINASSAVSAFYGAADCRFRECGVDGRLGDGHWCYFNEYHIRHLHQVVPSLLQPPRRPNSHAGFLFHAVYSCQMGIKMAVSCVDLFGGPDDVGLAPPTQ
jgi:hypothetical protein